MDDLTQFAESRSGEFTDIQRVDNAYKRWKRELPYIKRAAFGRYAPSFCFGKSGLSIDIRHFSGSNDDFCNDVFRILSRRYF